MPRFILHLSLLLVGVVHQTFAQTDSTYTGFGGIIYLDSFVVTASRAGFEIADFVDLVKTDSSFYTAFRNIRTLSYQSDNDIRFYDKKGNIKASYKSTTIQEVKDQCRTMKELDKVVTGNYYKRRKKLRYYTARLYEKIFFTRGKVCAEQGRQRVNSKRKQSKIDKHVEDLKVLIFQPGAPVNVPLVGKKAKLFSKALSPFYNFRIESKTYQQGIDCYVFTANIKDQYKIKKANKTIIKSLETYFDKSTFAVVARQYHLQYKSNIIDFDINIDIKLKKIGEKYVPEWLHLDGFWDIPMRPVERTWFETSFYGF